MCHASLYEGDVRRIVNIWRLIPKHNGKSSVQFCILVNMVRWDSESQNPRLYDQKFVNPKV